MSFQTVTPRFVMEFDPEKQDFIVYPRDVFYPGQPAFYLTIVDVMDFIDQARATLQLTYRQEKKKAPTGEQPALERREHGE